MPRQVTRFDPQQRSDFLTRLKLRLIRIWKLLQRENFGRLVAITLILISLSSLGLSLAEPGLSIIDSFWWSIVTITTVGYGDITPTTAVGRTIAVLDMLVGIGILATLSATIASILVDQKMREDLGMKSYEFQNHIIICEWNPRAKVILKELRHNTKVKTLPIVLIADIDRKPIDDEHLYFVQGQVGDETLKRANLAHAKTVIILGDDRLEYTDRDAKVVLSTLTVESINRDVYTIVELINEAYIPTCQRANADEIIVGSQLSSHLISTATLHHGMSKVVSDILSYEYGSQLYKIPVPPDQVGQSFLDIVLYIKQEYQSIAIAIQKGKEGQVISNPPGEERLEENDYLIVIATATRPRDLAKLKELQDTESDL